MPTSVNFEPEFPGQRPDEQIEMVLYKHWFKIVAPLARSILIIAASFFVPLWLNLLGSIFVYGITALIYYLWLVFWVGMIVYDYFNWYRDRIIITNHRLIRIDQRSLFMRTVSEVELDRIQNITYSIAGVFPTMLNYGTVTVQSAGSNDLKLEHIADPGELQQIIVQLVKESGQDKPLSAEELIDFIKDKKS